MLIIRLMSVLASQFDLEMTNEGQLQKSAEGVGEIYEHETLIFESALAKLQGSSMKCFVKDCFRHCSRMHRNST